MSIFPAPLLEKSAALLDVCRVRGTTIATAESCTGGLLSALLTEIPGSSDVFTHGFITYANAAKTSMLGVSETLLAQHGAVSEPVSRAMAEAALRAANSVIAIAITGIAGPGGGSAQKPVGLVHFSCAIKGRSTIHQQKIFTGDRSEIRLAAVGEAMEMMAKELIVHH